MADDIREAWPVRALRETLGTKIGLVVCSMLDHAYETENLLILLKYAFPGFVRLKPPFLCTCGKIALNGNIIADIATEVGITPTGSNYVIAKRRQALMFADKMAMEGAFRKLADRLKLTDTERRELFACVQKWIVADYRRNPRMDPRDPDAIRHVLH